MRIIDKNNAEQDWAYLTGKYGRLDLLQTNTVSERFVLVEIRETIGPAVCQVMVLGLNGEPLPGYQVAFAWPDAPVDLRPLDYVVKWADRVVIQPVNTNGDTGFGLGSGSFIRDLASGGPHTAWVLSNRIPSEGLGRFGMLGGTDHEGPLRLTFRLVSGSTLPPEPEPDKLRTRVERLERWAERLSALWNEVD